ncbi:ArdC family protein [Bradyrhizobium sp.]
MKTESTVAAARSDLYQRITDQIVRELERGVAPWRKPWDASHLAGRVMRPLRHNGVPYNGINTIVLWCEAVERGFDAPHWMTFRQALELGGHVRKGEKGSLVVYANAINRSEIDEATGEETARAIPYLKSYTVFNVAQIEGLPEQYRAKPAPRSEPLPRIERADRFFAATKADIRHGGDRAYYAAGSDHIQMPPFECFRDAESYAATLAHELTHWTKHTSRLGREFGRKRWGDEGYAMEELVAELGAAFLCADLDLTLDIRDDHAAYLSQWLAVLKRDNRAIFAAAAHAQRAADFLYRHSGSKCMGPTIKEC